MQETPLKYAYFKVVFTAKMAFAPSRPQEPATAP